MMHGQKKHQIILHT